MSDSKSLSEKLTRVVLDCDLDRVASSTVAMAKTHFLDGLGITIAGASTPIGSVARRYLEFGGRAEVGFLSAHEVLPPSEISGQLAIEDRAFLLGSYAFSENYGDTSLRSVAHPNTVIVPALIAAAAQRVVTGKRMLSGLLVGYQVMEFLARSLNNGTPRMAHQIRGFRPTATCGAAGAAAAIAHVWELDDETTQRAIEAACNYGGGLRRHGTGAQSSIRIQSGEVTRRGVTAVLLAQAGLEGERHMIEGDGGYFSAYQVGELDITASDYLPMNGESSCPPRWAVEDVAFKLHCTAHTLATVLDCILDIRMEHAISPGAVSQIELLVPSQHVTISASHHYEPPKNSAEASGSYPFCSGAVLTSGDFMWPDTLSEYLDDESVSRLASLVSINADPDLSAQFDANSGTWPARVTIVAGGKRYVSERTEPFGTVFDDSVNDQVRRKFVRLARREFSETIAGDLISVIDTMETLSDSYGALSRAVKDGN